MSASSNVFTRSHGRWLPLVGLSTLFALLFAGATREGAFAAEEPGSPRPGTAGENMALGAEYSLWPRPSYGYCTDPGDAVQLTDGLSTTEYFWTQKSTVGWQRCQYATITVDLGRVQPIGGFALTTAAGRADVTWPLGIQLLVSDDGTTYRDVGDLVALDHKENGPWPEGYAIRRLVTGPIETRGRFVQFLMIPLPAAPYVFVDEIEVFRGAEALLAREPAGEPIDDVAEYCSRGRLWRAVGLRFQNDATAIGKAISQAGLPDGPEKRQLVARLDDAYLALDPKAISIDTSFRAVLPFCDAHAKLFGVQADLWRLQGRKPLSAWVPATWDPVDMTEVPPERRPRPVVLDTMRGEYRAAAVNLANSTQEVLTARLRFEGLAGSPVPPCVTVHAVEWTDTSRGVPVAAALPEASRGEKGWTIPVVPGLSRQVWFTFHVVDLPPGEYDGAIVIEADGADDLRVPLRLRVWPFEFPERTSLLLGGWSYTNGRGTHGIRPKNRQAFLEHLQSHYVNAPWATSGVMRNFEFDKSDPTKVRLDTSELDAWIATWPDAEKYLVFLSVAHHSGTIRGTFGGAKVGTPEFDRRVATWITAWVEHLKSKGIEANRLGLLIHDEPHEGSDLGPFFAWARAIRKAQPDVCIWEDPTYRNPAKAPPELFEACDILCPNRPMWLAQGKRFAAFYANQQKAGRTLHFYSCSGPVRHLDPYAYYRLQAWQNWDAGGKGSFFWAFGDSRGSSSWNEYLANSGPYAPMFLDDESVTAGKQMEAIRESVEDYEYFVMLRDAVERAKAAGRGGEALARAESLLAHAAKEVLTAEGAHQLERSAAKDRTLADAVRVRILEALAAVSGEDAP